MNTRSFIDTVARGYARRYGDLSGFTFVFPNKRACSFFLKALASRSDPGGAVAPDVIGVSELIERVSATVPDSRIDLLFTLYDVYRSLPELEGESGQKMAFDAFRGWGEVVLSDFNEVDMYCVDAEKLFKNIYDYRMIETDALTEEQKEVLEVFFGEKFDSRKSLERFWLNFNYSSDGAEDVSTGIRERFASLWQNLWPLYTGLRERLSSQGLSTSGMAWQSALKRVRQQGAGAVGGSKIVFVGFNVLTPVEVLFFKTLKKCTMPDNDQEPFADFVWDLTGIPLKDGSNSAARFVIRNIRRFPKPEWLDLSASDTDGIPSSIELIAAPSNSVQAKIAGEIVGEIASKAGEAAVDGARMAVVLPDENLLIPMLYSLPDFNGKPLAVNLTMGYPLRLTPTLSLINILRRMQGRKRRSAAEYSYFYEDLQLLMAHPFFYRIVSPEEIEAFSKWLAGSRHFTVPAFLLMDIFPSAAPLFVPFTSDMACGPIGQLNAITALCEQSLEKEENSDSMNLDISHLHIYRDALWRLEDAMERHNVDFEWPTVFALAERLLAGEKVTFEGKPLQGVQIMGLLETRALDFDYIVVPSMNERVFPRRMRRRTFITANLRKGFGMPSASFQEAVFSYYFYRMIARARKLYMIYDARNSGVKSSGVSRYALQLQYIYASDILRKVPAKFRLERADNKPQCVKRSDPVNKQFEIFLREPPEGQRRRNLSSTAVWDYMVCPLKFYFKHLMRIGDTSDDGEHISVIDQGNIVHDTLQHIYVPDGKMRRRLLDKPIIYERDRILRLANDDEGLRKRVVESIKRVFLKLPEEGRGRELVETQLMVADQIVGQIKNVLLHDAELAPLYIYGTEVKREFSYSYCEGCPEVNMTFSIDRIDQPRGRGPLRIVDYKTGKPHLSYPDFETMFAGEYTAASAFQLITYSHFLKLLEPGRVSSLGNDLEMLVYHLGAKTKNEVEMRISNASSASAKNKAVMERFSMVAAEFVPRFREAISHIFTDSEMTPCVDEKSCDNCPYSQFCRR